MELLKRLKRLVHVAVLVGMLLVTYLPTCYATLIDTKTPIVIHGSGNDASESNFGYSLAFMKGSLENNRSPGASSTNIGGSLFIGAPNEKRFTKNSGVVWQCKFNGKNVQLSCSILTQVSQQNSPQEDTCSRNAKNFFTFAESEMEQMIGASLSASSSGLFAFAPRWKRNGWQHSRNTCSNDTAMLGVCYKATAANAVQVLEPLKDFQRNSFNLPLGGPTGRDWAHLTEFGFSSHVTRSENLIVGAPSSQWGRGNRRGGGLVVEYQRGEPDNPFLHNEHTSIEEADSNFYFGYTVTSGRSWGSGYYLASGAPRGGNLRGLVILIFNTTTSRNIATYRGEQLGSYFGYALATVDLNGDGYDELLVGAPMYTPDFTSANAHSTGCVLIFDVSRLPQFSQPLQPKLCTDSKRSSSLKISRGGRFGSAICNIGDINADTREDFAVSAPYDDNGMGTVFIYHGGFPLSDKPVQVIRGKSLTIPNLHGFGTYLLGGHGVDLDENGTPDLIVSAFESRHVIALRTRSVATASLSVSIHSAESDGGNGRILKLLPNQQGFRVRTCVKLKFSVPTPKINLNVWLGLDVDLKGMRVDVGNKRSQMESIHRIPSASTHCVDNKVSLFRDITQDNLTNVEPILVRASLKYNETEPTDNQTVQHASILLNSVGPINQGQAYQHAYRNFNPYLPSPIPSTESVPESLEIASDNCDYDKIPECDPDLRLRSTLLYRQTDDITKQKEWVSGGKSLFIGQVESMTISMAVSNQKETAYRPTFRITFSVNTFEIIPSLLRFVWQETPVLLGQCKPSVEIREERNQFNISHTLKCTRPLHHGREVKSVLEVGNLQHLKVKGDQTKGELNWTLEAFAEESEASDKVQEVVGVPLEGNVVINVDARVPASGQSEIDPTETTVVNLVQLYIIKNSGFSGTAMNLVKVEILVPTHLEVKGASTGVLGVANPSTPGIHCEAINFKFFELSTLERNKNRKMVLSNTASKSESEDKFITLSGCQGGGKMPTKSCQKIMCHMDLSSKGLQEIRIQMYLLQEAVGNLVTEETKGIRVETIMSVHYLGKVDRKVGSTQRAFVLAKKVPAWIYLASGAGGTILFLLTAFVLFKCGFFRRKTKEQLKQLKRQTMQMQQIDASTLMALYDNIPDQEDEDNMRHR